MSIAKALVIVLVIVALAVAIVFLMGQLEQTRPYYDLIVEKLQPVKDFVSQPVGAASTAGGIGTLVTVGGLAYSKYNEAKNKLSAAQTQINSQVASITEQKEAVEKQVAGYQQQVTDYKAQADAAKKELADYKATVGDPQSQINRLQAQVESVQNMNSQFVKNLMSAANGALVTNPLDGKIYSVLKLPPEQRVV